MDPRVKGHSIAQRTSEGLKLGLHHMVGITTAVPGIMWLSAHKGPLFLFATAMLMACSALVWQQRRAPCPLDPLQAQACMRLRRYSVWMLAISMAMLATGIFFAYLWPMIYL